ncbi:hypothetical protein [Paenisporosarcina indica]|uniref:hypothetical protein n=1 Tax=Paenisporosarcina indica TaxID=650093 RepID=UPI00094FE54C|nr:hypothetical protein [Paenisporosarcina indica]
MKKCIKISSAILAFGLISSTSIQVMANDSEKVDSSSFETVKLQDALLNVKEETTSVEDLQTIAINIPSGYLSNNLFALAQNIEKISNPKAKAALQKNIDKAIKKWEEKNKTELPPAEEVIVEDGNSIETNDQTAKSDALEPVKVEVPKEEKQVAKEARKKAKEAKKAEKKAIKENEKQERKEAHALKKEKQKQSKATKQEHKAEESKKQQ